MLYIILLSSLMFIACGELDSGQEHSRGQDLPIDSDRFNKLSDDERELLHNYLLLKALFYHPERIKNYSEYKDLTEVDAMYSSLNDYLKGGRYTRYYTPDIAEQIFSNIQNSEKYYSFGFERGVKRDTVDGVIYYNLIVTYVYPFSPATDAGLKKHDILLSANDTSLTGMTDTDLVLEYIMSDSLFANTTVFEVLRGTERLPLLAMQKEEVPVPTVYLDSLNGIPYISVTEFTQVTNNPKGTYYEFKEYLEEIKGAKTAIIDLRENGGGSIDHCTAMAAELVPLNKELVYDMQHTNISAITDTNYNIIIKMPYFARNYLDSDGAGIGINWIILMSEGSASCSERFIAAVKYNRPETVLIGENTFGKGIGQSYGFTYLDGLFSITSLQSFYPNGQTFHEVGILPDISVDPFSNEVYYAAIEAALGFPGTALAKRSLASIKPETLPQARKSKKTDLGMYHLLHQGK